MNAGAITPNSGADDEFDAAQTLVADLEDQVAACLQTAQQALGSKVLSHDLSVKPVCITSHVQCRAKFYNPANMNEKYQIEVCLSWH